MEPLPQRTGHLAHANNFGVGIMILGDQEEFATNTAILDEVDPRRDFSFPVIDPRDHADFLPTGSLWKKIHFILGSGEHATIVTVSVGFLTRHEARTTKALRKDTWRVIPVGPFVIALAAEIN